MGKAGQEGSLGNGQMDASGVVHGVSKDLEGERVRGGAVQVRVVKRSTSLSKRGHKPAVMWFRHETPAALSCRL